MYKLKNIMTDRALLETVNKVNTQYDIMPEASSLQGKVVQYTGHNTDNYKTGYFYLSNDKSGSWQWELVSGGTGGGGGEEPVSLLGVEIPLDTETGMYIYSLPNEEGMIYIASGYLVDFESDTGFAESAGNSAIVVWLSNENKLLNTFSIEFGTHSFSFDESWTSADGTSYINLEGITLIEDTPASITADITYLLSQMLSIDQIAGLRDILDGLSGGGGSDPHKTGTATVLTTAWEVDATYSGYGYRASTSVLGLTADFTGLVSFDDTALALEILKEGGKTYSGGFYVYASEIPSADITIESYIFWEV